MVTNLWYLVPGGEIKQVRERRVPFETVIREGLSEEGTFEQRPPMM